MIRFMHHHKQLGKIQLPSEPFLSEEDMANPGENPMSKLLEMLQIQQTKAEFTFEEMGKFYECTCSVYKYKAETTFKSVSKKIAKRVTAKKMYVLLSGMDLNDPKWEIDEKSTSDCEASQKNVSLSDKNIHSFLGIMNLTGDWIILDTDFLAKLHRTNHFCFLLEELGRKFNFKFEYFVIKEQNILQMYQVVVRLKTYPVVAVHGVGRTIIDAKHAAALQAIENINVLARRMTFYEKEHDFNRSS